MKYRKTSLSVFPLQGKPRAEDTAATNTTATIQEKEPSMSQLRLFRLRRRSAFIWAAVIFLLLFFRWLGAAHTDLHPQRPNLGTERAPDGTLVNDEPLSCANLKYLKTKTYGLSQKIRFQRRTIRAAQTAPVDRFAVDHVSEPLVGRGIELNLNDPCDGWIESGSKPVTLGVSHSYPNATFSELIFGLATSFDRLEPAIRHFAHWLGDTEAQLVIAVVDADKHYGEFDSLLEKFYKYNIKVHLIEPWQGAIGANREHFTVIRSILYYTKPETRWIGLVDDDTFFPSLYPVSQMLAEHDHTVPAYLGALSESAMAIDEHGILGFGGAGVFLSLPLAEQLDLLIEECLEASDSEQGDGLLNFCITRKTKTGFTQIQGLYQMDLMGGELGGFYESGRLPLSLHHWKSWHKAPVLEMASVTNYCGDCFLQRWKFSNDTVFTNGYSIAVYEDGTDRLNLKATEGTWKNPQDFAWSLGPMREKVTNKKTFHLIDTQDIGVGLRQLYIHRVGSFKTTEAGRDRDPEPGHKLEMPSEPWMRDEVVELIWEWEALRQGGSFWSFFGS